MEENQHSFSYTDKTLHLNTFCPRQNNKNFKKNKQEGECGSDSLILN